NQIGALGKGWISPVFWRRYRARMAVSAAFSAPEWDMPASLARAATKTRGSFSGSRPEGNSGRRSRVPEIEPEPGKGVSFGWAPRRLAPSRHLLGLPDRPDSWAGRQMQASLPGRDSKPTAIERMRRQLGPC